MSDWIDKALKALSPDNIACSSAQIRKYRESFKAKAAIAQNWFDHALEVGRLMNHICDFYRNNDYIESLSDKELVDIVVNRRMYEQLFQGVTGRNLVESFYKTQTDPNYTLLKVLDDVTQGYAYLKEKLYIKDMMYGKNDDPVRMYKLFRTARKRYGHLLGKPVPIHHFMYIYEDTPEDQVYAPHRRYILAIAEALRPKCLPREPSTQ